MPGSSPFEDVVVFGFLHVQTWVQRVREALSESFWSSEKGVRLKRFEEMDPIS